jgi:hypothetical protein
MALTLKQFFDLGFTRESVRPLESREEEKKQALQGAGFLALAAVATASVVSLIALVIVVGALGALMAFLRSRRNPTYWQTACWILVAVGILARQLFSENHRLDLTGFSVSLALSSMIVSLAVLPILMRWLNRISPGPNIQQIAVPFALGFFLDYAQVLTSTYILHLPWVTHG